MLKYLYIVTLTFIFSLSVSQYSFSSNFMDHNEETAQSLVSMKTEPKEKPSSTKRKSYNTRSRKTEYNYDTSDSSPSPSPKKRSKIDDFSEEAPNDPYTQEFKMWKSFLQEPNLQPTLESLARVRLGEMYLLGIGTAHHLLYAVENLMAYYDLENNDITLSGKVAYYMAQVHLGRYNTGQFAPWIDYKQAREFLGFCYEDSKFLEKEYGPHHPEWSPSHFVQMSPKQLSLHALLDLSEMDVFGLGIKTPNYKRAYDRLYYSLANLDKDDPDNKHMDKQMGIIVKELLRVKYFKK